MQKCALTAEISTKVSGGGTFLCAPGRTVTPTMMTADCHIFDTVADTPASAAAAAAASVDDCCEV